MKNPCMPYQDLNNYFSFCKKLQLSGVSGCPPPCNPFPGCPPPPCFECCHAPPECPANPECPDFPNILCTNGVIVYTSDAVIHTDESVTVENGFNANDGPAPWTITGAEFVGSQQAVYDLQETVTDKGRQINATVKPSVFVRYADGSGNQRTKFINFPVSINKSFAAANPQASLKYYAETLPGGTIGGISSSGGSISFTASYSLKISAFSDPSVRLPVIQGYTCDSPPSCIAYECVTIMKIKAACDPFGIYYLRGSVPYRQEGTPPVTFVAVTPADTAPNIVSATGGNGNDLNASVSFPSALSIRDSGGTYFRQDTLVYSSFSLEKSPFAPGDTLIADIRADYMTRPSSQGNYLSTLIPSVSGRIIILGPPERALVAAAAVDCGTTAFERCRKPEEIEPTTAP